MKKRKIIVTLFIGMILFLANNFWSYASDEDSTETESPSYSAEKEVSIYCLSPTYENYIQIPSDYLTSYTLSDNHPIITSGESVVIENNIVKPKTVIKYSHQLPSGFWVESSSPSGEEGEITKLEYVSGDSIVELDDGTSILFHVVDYAKEYVNQVVESYLEENITSEMSELEKAKKCCEFVCSYDYGSDSSSCAGMIITGSGDCWASTDTLLYMFKKLNITSSSRDASNNTGAGSGHVNVIAVLDGSYYMIEAGINANAPRPYYITEYTSEFIYTKLTDSTISITGYFDFNGAEEITIPSEIDGYTVTQIGTGAFANYSSLTSITLPDSITSIGSSAFKFCTALENITLPAHLKKLGDLCFYWANSLKEINIPASVTDIGTGCFTDCNLLQAINVDDNNLNYSSKEGVLYDKAQTSLIQFPCGKTNADYILPATVTTIKIWAFRSANLRHLTLHNALKSIEWFAFQYTLLPVLSVPDSLSSIDESVFEDTEISKIELPDSIKRIEKRAFASSGICEINLPDHLEYIGDEAFEGNKFLKRLYIPSSVQEVGNNAFLMNLGWSSMGSGSSSSIDHCILLEKGCNISFGENVFSDVILGVEPNSSMHNYVLENNIPYLELDETGKIPLQDDWFKTIPDYRYAGVEIIPEISYSKTDSPLILEEDLDYQITCSNNTDPGTATATLTGNRLFSGTLSRTFQISKDCYRLPESFWEGFTIQDDSIALSWKEECSVNRYGKWYTKMVYKTPKATYYEIYRQKEGEKDSVKLGTTSGTTWTDKTVKSTSKYLYTINAYDEDGFIASTHYSVWYLKPVELIDTYYTQTSPKYMTISVTWNTVPGADYYLVHRKEKGSCGEGAVIVEPSSATSMSCEFSMNTGEYDVWVTACKGVFESAASDIRTPSEAPGFTISSETPQTSGSQSNVTKPATPKITKLRNIASKKLQVYWKKILKAKGYQVQYSTSSKFKNAKTVKIASGGTTKTTLKKLKKGKTYYVRIRSYTKTGNSTSYSKWSSAKKIKIKK